VERVGPRPRASGRDGPDSLTSPAGRGRLSRLGISGAVAYPHDVALSLRSRIEHASVPWVERMHRIPRPAALGVLLVVLAVGVLAPTPWSGIAFLVVGLFIGWLLFLTWQQLRLPERLMRIAVLALVLAVTIVKLVPGA
jgi:hypothetical protein